jgi:hypothetical protein
MTSAPEVLLRLLEHEQEDRPVEGEEVVVPRERGEEVEAGESCLEEEVAEGQLERDSRMDERIGEEVQPRGASRESRRPAPTIAGFDPGSRLSCPDEGSPPRTRSPSRTACTGRSRSAPPPCRKSRPRASGGTRSTPVPFRARQAMRAWTSWKFRSEAPRATTPCRSRSRSSRRRGYALHEVGAKHQTEAQELFIAPTRRPVHDSRLGRLRAQAHRPGTVNPSS